VRDTPTIQIIDRAVPPQQKYYPKRMYIVAGACLSSLLFSLFLTIYLESMRQAQSSGTVRGKQIDQILTELQSMKLWGRK